MKKIFAILLCAVMVFSLAACSGQNEQSSQGSSGSNSSAEESTPPESSSEPTEQPNEPSEPASSETPSDTPSTEPVEGKTLVVYYSATNNTKAVAGYIADATGADLFELIPVEPYTSDDLDWTDRDSRVSREHDDESLRVVELENAVPDNWDDYDTVFIGYPI